MKKIYAIPMAFVMACSLTACATATPQTTNEEPESPIKDGSYTSTVDGRNGKVTVEVTVASSKIEKVEVTEQSESAGIADGALEQIPERIVEKQSINVDTVSGATITSNAIIEAAENCLKEAGFDVGAMKAVAAESDGEKETVTLSTDIIVVGAGVSGLSTAISAKENGADVIVLEKLSRTGGSAIYCSGNFASYGTTSEKEQGIKDSLEEAMQHWRERTEQSTEETGYPNYDRVEYVLPFTAETIDWYAGYGMEFEPSKAPSFASLSTTRAVGKGSAMIAKMTEIAEQVGVTFMLETPATELMTKDGAVVGVKAESSENVYEISAKNVILATGGFGADAEEVAEKVPLYAQSVSLASSGNVGDGIEMAKAVGAVEYENPFVIAYTIQPAPQIKQTVPEASILTDDRHGGFFADKVLVNANGERYVNESQQYSVVSIATAYNQPTYLILDSSDEEVARIMDQCLETGAVFKGETIEELAENANINTALKETIAQYNELVANEEDTQFKKKAEKMTAYAEVGPYYAVQYFPGVTGTLGGVKTDFNGHVLDGSGNVISGLYAVGEMSNREYYNQTYIGASSVSFSSTMGRLTGKLAVEEMK